jgi:ankyrin repeat protein
MFAIINNNYKAFKLLMSLKANLNIYNNEGQYPIHLATLKLNHEMVMELKESGAEINVVDNNKNTSLHLII